MLSPALQAKLRKQGRSYFSPKSTDCKLEEDPSENSHSSPTVGQVSTPSSSVSLTRLQTVQNADCSPKFGRCHSAVEDCCSKRKFAPESAVKLQKRKTFHCPLIKNTNLGTQEKDEEGGANNTAIQTIIDRIRPKEEILRKLKLVQFYRQKNEVRDIDLTTSKLLQICQQVAVDLHETLPNPKPTMTEFLRALKVDYKLIKYNTEEETFE